MQLVQAYKCWDDNITNEIFDNFDGRSAMCNMNLPDPIQDLLS